MSEIKINTSQVQQRIEEAKNSTNRAISLLNDAKGETESAILGINFKMDSIQSDISGLIVHSRNESRDMFDMRSHFESIKHNIEQIKKKQVNIQKTLTIGFLFSKVVLLTSQHSLKINTCQIKKLKKVIRAVLDVGKTNARKIDGLKNSTQVVEDDLMTTEKILQEIKQEMKKYQYFERITSEKRGKDSFYTCECICECFRVKSGNRKKKSSEVA